MILPLIPLTKAKNSRVHPYPYQIAIQTQRFIQGSVLYSALADFGAGQFFHTPDAYMKAKANFINAGMSEASWEISWGCFEEYAKIFPNPVYQGALYSMNFHWDWFIVRTAKFVRFGRSYAVSPTIDTKITQKLNQIGFEKFAEQIKILINATGLNFNFLTETIESIEEMILVRNLGVHNDWEVDMFYKERTKSNEWSIGDIRLFSISELIDWHKSLLQIIKDISTPIAEKYVDAPEFKL